MRNKKIVKNNAWYTEDGGVFDEFYLKEVENVISPQRTKKEVDFIENALNLRKGAEILDLACGEGRHSLELARRGYDVVGQDINSYFLEIAEEKAKKEKLKVEFINSDMRTIKFKDRFDAVLLLFNSFGYFEQESDHRRVLDQIRAALRPGGKFILDIDNVERYKDKERKIYESVLSDQLSVKTVSVYDATIKKLIQDRIRYKGGKEILKFRSQIRMFSIPEIKKLLERAGLETRDVFSNYEGIYPTKETKRFVVIAQKPQ